MKLSERNKKYAWLVKAFEEEFKIKVEQKELSNNISEALKSSGKDFLIQILKTPVTETWNNGTWTDHYQVNLYIASHVPDAQELTSRVKAFLRNTLAGVNAGDTFLNTSQAQPQNYWFKLLVQEGV